SRRRNLRGASSSRARTGCARILSASCRQQTLAGVESSRHPTLRELPAQVRPTSRRPESLRTSRDRQQSSTAFEPPVVDEESRSALETSTYCGHWTCACVACQEVARLVVRPGLGVGGSTGETGMTTPIKIHAKVRFDLVRR